MQPDAFHKLALAELDAVYRFAFHLARRQPEAEDLVQETYLKALRACDNFVATEHGIRPWLFKILHNLVNTKLAKGQRDRKLLEAYGAELDFTAAASTEGQSTTEPGPAGSPAVDWESVDQRIKAAVLELPLSYRVVFLLSAVEGLKYREIADLTDVPIGTVMSRLSRARRTLADQLTDVAADHNLRRTAVESDGRGNKTDAGARSPIVDQPGKEASGAT